MIIVIIITLSELFQFDEPRFHPTTLRLLLNKGEQEPISQSSTMQLYTTARPNFRWRKLRYHEIRVLSLKT